MANISRGKIKHDKNIGYTNQRKFITFVTINIYIRVD